MGWSLAAGAIIVLVVACGGAGMTAMTHPPFAASYCCLPTSTTDVQKIPVAVAAFAAGSFLVAFLYFEIRRVARSPESPRIETSTLYCLRC